MRHAIVVSLSVIFGVDVDEAKNKTKGWLDECSTTCNYILTRILYHPLPIAQFHTVVGSGASVNQLS